MQALEHVERRRRGVFVAFGSSLLLLPSWPAASLISLVLAIGWLLLLLSAALAPSRARLGTLVASGMLVVVVWMLAAPAYPATALAFALLVLVAPLVGPAPRLRPRELLLALGVAALPCAIGALAWSLGDARAHDALREDFRLPTISYELVVAYGEIAAAGAAAFALLTYVAREDTPTARSSVVVVAGLLAVLTFLRARALVSLAGVPGDAQWSEPPILLNLLKLHAHQPLYGPYEDCGSYSYSPALEIVHRALLAPLGLDLSLRANRGLGFVWQLGTTAVLASALVPFFRRSLVVRVLVVSATALVVTSSFLASNLHPDHLLMLVFASALALALHGRRVAPHVRDAGLVLVPALCVAVKLTGAGVGLGLALAFVVPWQRRVALALALGAALSVLTLVVSEQLFPGFWRYTFALQASHPIRWDMWTTVFREPPTRLAIVAFVALIAARWLGDRANEARSDARRVLLVTLGFTLPSLVAYLKVGGRVNSLLPLAIGGAVALARLGAEACRKERVGLGGVATALALWMALQAVPSLEPVSSELRALADERHDQAVALVRRELASGRHPLYYEGTAPWVDARTTEVPRDRQQIMNELVMGKHPEVEKCYARLASGAYDSIITSDGALDPAEPTAARLAVILDAHFERASEVDAPGARLAPLHVYRYKR